MNVELEIAVAWGDMDAYAHVNNTVYLRWCESARLKFFESTGIDRLRETTGLGAILAEIACRYKAPVTYPDTVRVSVRLERWSESDFCLRYRLFSQRLQCEVAVVSDRLVAYDYPRLAKAHWPGPIQQQLAARQDPQL